MIFPPLTQPWEKQHCCGDSPEAAAWAASSKSAAVNVRPSSSGMRRVFKKSGPVASISTSSVDLLWLPFDVDVAGPKAATQQCVRRVADRDDARKCGDLILQVAVKTLNLRIPVFFEGGIYAEEQDVSRVETGIDATEVFERPHHQARANENNHRKPHLDDHERLLQMPSPARVCSLRREASRHFP